MYILMAAYGMPEFVRDLDDLVELGEYGASLLGISNERLRSFPRLRFISSDLAVLLLCYISTLLGESFNQIYSHIEEPPRDEAEFAQYNLFIAESCVRYLAVNHISCTVRMVSICTLLLHHALRFLVSDDPAAAAIVTRSHELTLFDRMPPALRTAVIGGRNVWENLFYIPLPDYFDMTH